MADELFEVLTRFHREIVLPDLVEKIDKVHDQVGSVRGEVLAHFDEMYRRFDRLELEYQALAASVVRLEAQVVTRQEFQHDIETLKARIKDLEHRLDQLQAES